MQIDINEYLNEARVKEKKGDLDGAEKMYQHLIETQPYNALPYNYLGLMKAEAGDYTGAIVSLERAVELEPNCVTSRLGLARLYRCVHDYVGAELSLRKAVEMAPNDERLRQYFLLWLLKPERETFVRVGFALENKVNYFGAEAVYRKAITTIPRDPACWYMLAMVHFKNEAYEAAMSAFDQAIQLDEAFGLALWGKGNCLAMTGKRDEGLELAKYVAFNFMTAKDDLSSTEVFNRRASALFEKLGKH